MAATKEQIVRAYKALETAELRHKKAKDDKKSSVDEAKKARDAAIESPDATVKDIVEKHAERKAVQARATEEVADAKTDMKEAKGTLDEMIRSADQYGLFDEPDEASE